MSNTRYCKDCLWAEEVVVDDQSLELFVCRRHPPVFLGGDPSDVANWGNPVVAPHHGCGDHDFTDERELEASGHV